MQSERGESVSLSGSLSLSVCVCMCVCVCVCVCVRVIFKMKDDTVRGWTKLPLCLASYLSIKGILPPLARSALLPGLLCHGSLMASDPIECGFDLVSQSLVSHMKTSKLKSSETHFLLLC